MQGGRDCGHEGGSEGHAGEASSLLLEHVNQRLSQHGCDTEYEYQVHARSKPIFLGL